MCKKRMRLVGLVGLIVVLLFALSFPLVAAEKHYLFGVSQPTFNHPIRQAHYWAAKLWQKDHPNVEFIFTDAQKNAAQQIRDVENLMARHVDVILIAEHLAGSTNRVLKQARAMGIHVIAFDRVLTDPTIPESTIAADDREMGRLCGQYIVERLKKDKGEVKGNLVIIQAPEGVEVGIRRREGLHDVIDKYPGIKILTQQVGNWQRAIALQVMENVLRGFPNIDVVYCDNDEMALGAIKAIKEAGRQNEIFVVGIDGEKAGLEAIMRGEYAFTVKKTLEFPTALDIALKVVKGEEVPKRINLPLIGVSEENVEEVYDPFALF